MERTLNRNLAAVVATILVLIPAGCDNGPNVAPVHGKITVGGKPLTEGNIVFMPSNGRMAHGKIQPDGSYRLTTFESNDGALIGDHSVTIEAVVVESNAAELKTLEEEISNENQPRRLIVKETHLVPEKYADPLSSELKATVKDQDDNEFNFDL